MTDELDRKRIAVALSYEAPTAPRVVATGRGAVAEAILATAREAGVAIEENPELAEALARIVEGIRSELDDMPPSRNPGACN